MGARFNPPPGWPAPPDDWRPTPTWVPDPSWPASPPGWQFWIIDDPAPDAFSPPLTPTGGIAPDPGSALTRDIDAGIDPGIDPGIDLDDPAAVAGSGRGRRLAIIGAALAAVVGSAGVVGWVNTHRDDPATSAQTGGRSGMASSSTSTASSSAASSASSSAPSEGGTVTGPTPTVAGTSATAAPDTALAALESLSSRPEGSAPYLRAAFGTGWADPDHNGCDTGNDVLARDLSSVTRRGKCVVVGGRLLDPYVGRSVTARSVSGVVALDFVVPLADAWINGAGTWTAPQRAAFVNDPRNLQAIQSTTAQKKRSRDAAGYLPSSVAYRCAYVARQIGVKLAYGLSVGEAEATAMRTVLTTCPRQPLPEDLRPDR